MKALVLGATGRLGQMLQWAWRDVVGVNPIWHTRNAPRGPAQNNWVVGDPLDPSHDLVKAATQADVIVNLLGVTPGPGVDLGLNIPLGLAPFGMAPKARVILPSSAAVYGKAGLCFEDTPPAPLHAYGKAKWKMEQAAPPGCLIARIGNVAGADQLLGGLQENCDPVLHVFTDGTTPMRSYIGPQALGDVWAALVRLPRWRDDVINIAAPQPVVMGDLLDAAGRSWTSAPAPDTLPRRVVFDTTRLQSILPALPSTPADIVADWQAWHADTGGFE